MGIGGLWDVVIKRVSQLMSGDKAKTGKIHRNLVFSEKLGF
jgi:hypothetical protein